MIKEAYDAGQEAAFEKLAVSLGAFLRASMGRQRSAGTPPAKKKIDTMLAHGRSGDLQSKVHWTEARAENPEGFANYRDHLRALKGKKNVLDSNDVIY